MLSSPSLHLILVSFISGPATLIGYGCCIVPVTYILRICVIVEFIKINKIQMFYFSHFLSSALKEKKKAFESQITGRKNMTCIFLLSGSTCCCCFYFPYESNNLSSVYFISAYCWVSRQLILGIRIQKLCRKHWNIWLINNNNVA